MEQRAKVGIISCSGEDLCEGTISRLATRQVLEELWPTQTVTICLPLFLAGDAQERAFAQNHPTIVVDGCDKGCARQGTEKHSGPVTAALVVTEILAEEGMGLSGEKSGRRLSPVDLSAIEMVASRIVREVDRILSESSNVSTQADDAKPGECACSRSLPGGTITVDGRTVSIEGLPLIFQRLVKTGLTPEQRSGQRLLASVKNYFPICPEEEASFQAALVDAYRVYCSQQS